MSEGMLYDLISRCASYLVEVEQQLKEALITGSVIHQDETGLYVESQYWWLHVTCTPTLTRLSGACQPRACGLGRHRHLASLYWHQRADG